MPYAYSLLEMNFMHDVHTNNISRPYTQGGGAGSKAMTEKTHAVEDKGKTYHFRVRTEHSKEMVRIIVITENEEECITVIIYEGDTDAILHNMSNYSECAKEGLVRPGGGTLLLRFIHKYLVDAKKRYNINRIVLKDNSYVYCEKCAHTPKLARLKSLTHGYTWYSKYGFKPYDPVTKKPDKEMLEAYHLNKKIAIVLKTSKVDVLQIAKQLNKDTTNEHLDMEELKNLTKMYPLMSLFVRRLVTKYDKYCCLIHYILERIYVSKPPNISALMYDMYGKDFYLDI